MSIECATVVIKCLIAHGPITISEVVQRTKVHHNTVYRWVNALYDQGLLRIADWKSTGGGWARAYSWQHEPFALADLPPPRTMTIPAVTG